MAQPTVSFPSHMGQQKAMNRANRRRRTTWGPTFIWPPSAKSAIPKWLRANREKKVHRLFLRRKGRRRLGD